MPLSRDIVLLIRIINKQLNQTIVNWENGVTEIKYRSLAALSELYDMPIEFLRLPEDKKTARKD